MMKSYSLPCFNSIKVRLKPEKLAFIDCMKLCFNSIKVRLKPACSQLPARPHSFQFHKGPIKAFVLSGQRSKSDLFQFHKGPIKALIKMQKQTMPLSFNSIKVRLKRLARYHLALGFAFQFHKGPIKARMMATRKLLQYLFQFHKGPIKAHCIFR